MDVGVQNADLTLRGERQRGVAAVVDFPTPPLPEAMATMCLTFAVRRPAHDRDPAADLTGSPMLGPLRRQRDGGGNHAGKGMTIFGFLAKQLHSAPRWGSTSMAKATCPFLIHRANHPGGYDIDAIDGVLDTFQGF